MTEAMTYISFSIKNNDYFVMVLVVLKNVISKLFNNFEINFEIILLFSKAYICSNESIFVEFWWNLYFMSSLFKSSRKIN